jgi:hypothetical protein
LTRCRCLPYDEADVGQLSPASKVTFTVDAFPQGVRSASRRSGCRLRWCERGDVYGGDRRAQSKHSSSPA